ncbi:MAG: efflux RND transporter periplasmic adaptor subunit [Acidobacteriota bacterium]|nr:efflux RND transporter periplasmic adaptor subunit [Acidobacteriota bacterium]
MNPEQDEQQPQPGTEEHHKSQIELDDEIQQIEQRAKHQHAAIERPPALPPAKPGRALGLVACLVLLLLLGGGVTLLQRARQENALAKETNANAIPTLSVTHPVPEAADSELALPGSLQAYIESPIYARTNGYLLRWTKDIGSRVKKGELLAVIDTPEVDQELNQARAVRQQVYSQLELAKISTDRWQNLRKTDSVSAQEADQQASAFQQAKANLASADANVRRLEQLESFKNVYAPFSGVLTKRNVDPGALIAAGSAGKEMFDIAQVETLRVFVNVPQAYSTSIKAGGNAAVTLQELPGRSFAGIIARTAEAIDPATRTLLVEVDVDNKTGELLPGAFGQVHFSVGGQVTRLTVPVNTLIFRSQGAQVAVVGQNSKVQLRPLNIGRDYGSKLEVLSGLDANEWIVVNPPDSLENGQDVHTVQQPEQKPAQNQPGQAKKTDGSAS